ncbi:hypothetical protein [Actinocrispum wychmicini]|uniref:Uncharacterized protein n=1 Tax=Actinocrispum wychmicini TaxID=1213861 RepID=A0A4R2IQ82_9PSEU|nr:hypothetical protein [Actinocrispum wychmicini]TCO47324.1 hypothetical protein EV192_11764 [Actinocrispum wychmicini]
MARDHARIDVSIWDDPDFLELSCQAQRLYFLLLSQRELSYSGLLPMRLRRWASRSRSTTVEAITAALAELDAARFVVCDHDAEEVLIRSLIRNDGIYKQPNVLAGALREAFLITSPVLRAALASELRRLPTEVVGAGPEMAAVALVAGVTELPAAIKTAGTGGRKPKAAGAEERPRTRPAPSRPQQPPRSQRPPRSTPEQAPPAGRSRRSNSPANPSAKGSPQGQGGGGRGQRASVAPLTLETPTVGGDPRAREHAHPRADAPTREQAARLVDQEIPGQPQVVAARLAREAAELLLEGIDQAHVAAGLQVWAGKQLGTRLLPDLVAEAMRAPTIAVASARRARSTTDERVAAAFALADHFAAEEARDRQHDTSARPDDGPRVGDLWDGEHGWDGQAGPLAGLLAGVA